MISIDFWMPLAIALLSGAAWFMALVAGACIGRHIGGTINGKMWYACSVIAVIFVAQFAWLVGRHVPH